MSAPFRLDVPDATLDDIRRRVDAFPRAAMPRGGRFAAMGEPGLPIEDVRAFARTLRG